MSEGPPQRGHAPHRRKINTHLSGSRIPEPWKPKWRALCDSGNSLDMQQMAEEWKYGIRGRRIPRNDFPGSFHSVSQIFTRPSRPFPRILERWVLGKCTAWSRRSLPPPPGPACIRLMYCLQQTPTTDKQTDGQARARGKGRNTARISLRLRLACKASWVSEGTRTRTRLTARHWLCLDRRQVKGGSLGLLRFSLRKKNGASSETRLGNISKLAGETFEKLYR